MSRKMADRPKSSRRLFFGRALRKLREGRGWSQEKLAGAASVSQAIISMLESGAKQPGWDTVQALAEALEVSTEEFRG